MNLPCNIGSNQKDEPLSALIWPCGVNQIDDPVAVDRAAGKPLRVPDEDAVGVVGLTMAGVWGRVGGGVMGVCGRSEAGAVN